MHDDNQRPGRRDNKDRQLADMRVRLEGSHLTTQQGVRVDHTDDSISAGGSGPTLLEDFHAREILMAGHEPQAGRSRVSWWLSRLDRHASRPVTAVLVIGMAVAWIVVSVAVGFPSRWEIIFQSLVAALTLVMVLVIQHTQARHQRATQRKLDEILLAMPDADNSLLTLERASDEALRNARHQHQGARRATRDDGTSGPRRQESGAGMHRDRQGSS